MSPKRIMGGRRFGAALAAALAVGLLLAAPWGASGSVIADRSITITVQTAVGTESVPFQLPDELLNGNGQIHWQAIADQVNGLEIRHGGILLATIHSLECTIVDDPAVQLNFSITAGSVDATVLYTSAVVSFSGITNPDAYATAAMTVTDNDRNGATSTGLLTGTKAYQAIYNGSTVWANLVDPVTVLPRKSGFGGEDRPLSGGTEVIPATVSSIQSQFSFTLSANDQASGTSTFEVTPEPATLTMLVLGGGAILLRRRRA